MVLKEFSYDRIFFKSTLNSLAMMLSESVREWLNSGGLFSKEWIRLI
jgi:hypothetical protein